MVKNKYDFIKDLIEDKKASKLQRERILKLAINEMHSDSNLSERVTKIEELIHQVKNPAKAISKAKNEQQQKTKKEVKPPKTYLYPSSLYKYLLAFNQHPLLKYTCHDIDGDALESINKICGISEYNFKKHIEQIAIEFELFDKKHFAPSKSIALIRGYLFGKNHKNEPIESWGSQKLKFNWSHPDLIHWSINNPGIPPNLSDGLSESLMAVGYEFDFPLKANYEPIMDFNEFVNYFKHRIHIRQDNSIKQIIHKLNIIRGWNEQIDFIIHDDHIPSNIEFFTDVDKFSQAYQILIELVLEVHPKNDEVGKPQVKLYLEEEAKGVQFTLHHMNTTYQKTITNTIERTGKTINGLISNQVNGMCNLYLKADFGQGNYAEINLWNGKEKKAKRMAKFTGVAHVLEFTKK